MTAPRKFVPSVKYNGNGWLAIVTVQGAFDYYWRGSRFTRTGAEAAALRMARKFNRLEAKGMVQ